MNIYVNINGKTRYFKSREEANAALGKKPVEGKKPAKGKKSSDEENNKQQDNE